MQFINTIILYIEEFIDLDSVITVLLKCYSSYWWQLIPITVLKYCSALVYSLSVGMDRCGGLELNCMF